MHISILDMFTFLETELLGYQLSLPTGALGNLMFSTFFIYLGLIVWGTVQGPYGRNTGKVIRLTGSYTDRTKPEKHPTPTNGPK